MDLYTGLKNAESSYYWIADNEEHIISLAKMFCKDLIETCGNKVKIYDYSYAEFLTDDFYTDFTFEDNCLVIECERILRGIDNDLWNIKLPINIFKNEELYENHLNTLTNKIETDFNKRLEEGLAKKRVQIEKDKQELIQKCKELGIKPEDLK